MAEVVPGVTDLSLDLLNASSLHGAGHIDSGLEAFLYRGSHKIEHEDLSLKLPTTAASVSK